MNVKSMLVGFLIAVVASTGTYFLVPPPSGAEASAGIHAHGDGIYFYKKRSAVRKDRPGSCATTGDVKRAIQQCWFQTGAGKGRLYRPDCEVAN